MEVASFLFGGKLSMQFLLHTYQEREAEMENIFKNLIIAIGLLALFAYKIDAKWVKINSLQGWIVSLGVNSNNIFAMTADNGVFLSTDNGESWTAVNNGLSFYNGTALVVSGNNIFAGFLGEGIYLSNNNGTSWKSIDSGLTNKNIVALAISGNNIYAGIDGGVFISTDYGISWNSVLKLPTNTVYGINVNSLAVSGNKIFVGAGGGVYISTDNGYSWKADNFNPSAISSVFSLAINSNNIFAGTEFYYGPYSPDNGFSFFLSTDNGKTWTTVDTGIPANTYITSFLVSGNNIFAGTDAELGNKAASSIYFSINNGTKWSTVDSGIPANTHICSFAESGNNIFVGTDSGIWRRPLSEIVGIINKNPQQGISKPYKGEFKINTNKNSLTLLLPKTFNDDANTVRLFTIAGKKIYSTTNMAYNDVLNIPISGFSTGTYLISIAGGNTKYISSFVLTK